MSRKDKLKEMSNDEIMESEPNAEVAYDALSRIINRMDDGGRDALVELLSREHRTLQQTTIGLALKILYRFADKEEIDTDPRNSAGVQRCKEIKRFLGHYGDCLPTI